MNKLIFISVLFIVTTLQTCFGQRNMADSTIGTPLLGIQYGLGFSGGDLVERYGAFNHLGFTAGYKFRTNWYAGLDANFLFGKKINMNLVDIFGALLDSKGNITDQNGDIANVLLFSRGLQINVEIGKVFSKIGHNENSGLMIKIGGGYLNHRMRIETNDQVVPAIELDYKRGYDRLTTGFNASQFLGYLFMSDNSFLNFYAGGFITEGFTKNRRNYFYDQPGVPAPTETRLDLLYGFKVGWLIPVYKRKPKEFYYN